MFVHTTPSMLRTERVWGTIASHKGTVSPIRCGNSSKSLWGRVQSCRIQVGTGFITRECQTVVELVRRDCLARLTIVDREMNETKPLSHVHFRQLYVEISSTVLMEVVATYPYHLHILTTANQPVVYASRNLYPIVNVSAITRNCLLYTSPSPRDKRQSRMPSSA